MVTVGYCASQYLLCELCKPFSLLQMGMEDLSTASVKSLSPH